VVTRPPIIKRHRSSNKGVQNLQEFRGTNPQKRLQMGNGNTTPPRLQGHMSSNKSTKGDWQEKTKQKPKSMLSGNYWPFCPCVITFYVESITLNFNTLSSISCFATILGDGGNYIPLCPFPLFKTSDSLVRINMCNWHSISCMPVRSHPKS